MAITSAGGAILTKTHSSGAGSPTQVAITSQSYCGWIKLPSIGTDRTLFDHDGKITIKNNAAGRLELWIDGVLVGTGTTIFTANRWTFWSYKKTAANLHTVKIAELTCVSNSPVMGPVSTQISVTQALLPGNPIDFTLHVPAGCGVCHFFYGYDGVADLISTRFGWGFSPVSSLAWLCPLRFPNDLYDHREITASSPPTTFQGMHNWDSQVGTITLHPDGDPEHLLDKSCSAIVGILTSGAAVFTQSPPGDIVPASSTITLNQPVAFTIRTDVLPATSKLTRISLDGFITISNEVGLRTYPNIGNRWTSSAFTFPDEYASHGLGGFLGYYVWSTQWDGPNPNVNHPGTGLPWTVNDLYNSTFEILAQWINLSGGPTNAVRIHSFEIGISVIYQGQVTPGQCGLGPPAAVGTIIVDKVVIPDGGEIFEFNAVNLTPNAFSIDSVNIQQYNNVPAGNGYGITEIVPAGWTVSYSVSNGSPHNNISVVAGDTVVVTVTNVKLPNELSGIYKIVPGKRQDTLWLEGFVGTRDVKIP